jgi:hypothetical protein
MPMTRCVHHIDMCLRIEQKKEVADMHDMVTLSFYLASQGFWADNGWLITNSRDLAQATYQVTRHDNINKTQIKSIDSISTKNAPRPI